MSGDEIFVTFAALVLGPAAWAFWLYRLASIDVLRRQRSPVVVLAAAVGLQGALIFLILRFCAADDVREAPQYLFMYFVLGFAWMRIASWLFPLAGLNPRDDLVERANRAAVPAWIGAMTGVALCYSGGNVGNGPGWWVVVYSAALATAGLGLVWVLVGHWTSLMDAVTIDRDPAAGVRLGGLLVACGLLFGAAVTGDWVSVAATNLDFMARSWMAGVILVLAAFIEQALRPRPERPRADFFMGGVMPAGVYLALAAVAVKLPELLAT